MSKPGFLILNLLTAFIVFILLISSSSCAAPQGTQTLEEQAREIYSDLMCPLCPGQTIGQSPNELSAQMRALVREKLAEGETREEILQFFVERYGETVLAAPVKSGFNLIVWVTPILGIFTVGIVLWIIIRRRVRDSNKSSARMLSATSGENLDGKYLDQLEKDLEGFEEKGFR